MQRQLDLMKADVERAMPAGIDEKRKHKAYVWTLERDDRGQAEISEKLIIKLDQIRPRLRVFHSYRPDQLNSKHPIILMREVFLISETN